MGTRYSLNLGNGRKKAVFSYAFDDQRREPSATSMFLTHHNVTGGAMTTRELKRILEAKVAELNDRPEQEPRTWAMYVVMGCRKHLKGALRGTIAALEHETPDQLLQRLSAVRLPSSLDQEWIEELRQILKRDGLIAIRLHSTPDSNV